MKSGKYAYRLIFALFLSGATFQCTAQLPPTALLRDLVHQTSSAIVLSIDSVVKMGCEDCTSTGNLYAVYGKPVKTYYNRTLRKSVCSFLTAQDASDSSSFYFKKPYKLMLVFVRQMANSEITNSQVRFFSGVPDIPGEFLYSRRLEKIIQHEIRKK